MMRNTTDITLLKKGITFTWGTVVQIHEVGPYAVVEYIDSHGTLLFHSYADGKDLSQSTDTIEGALAHAIAVKWDGINTQAGRYFVRMIGVTVPEDKDQGAE
jgi:hypothetical protein